MRKTTFFKQQLSARKKSFPEGLPTIKDICDSVICGWMLFWTIITNPLKTKNCNHWIIILLTNIDYIMYVSFSFCYNFASKSAKLKILQLLQRFDLHLSKDIKTNKFGFVVVILEVNFVVMLIWNLKYIETVIASNCNVFAWNNTCNTIIPSHDRANVYDTGLCRILQDVHMLSSCFVLDLTWIMITLMHPLRANKHIHTTNWSVKTQYSTRMH